MDELEFEVTPTDTGEHGSVRAPRRLPAPRRPPRAVTIALISALVVVVTAALTLASVPNLSGRVSALLHGTPTATPRILPGGNLLYVENAVTWGTLRLNGSQVVIDGLQGNDTSLVLQRGANTIVYRAEPFPTLQCTISVPVSKKDTCPIDPAYANPDGQLAPAARALNLTPTLGALPASAREELLGAVNTYLGVQSAAAVVQPGEPYVNADHQIVVTQQAMQATFTQTLSTDVSDDPCDILCVAPPDPNLRREPVQVANFVLNAHVVAGFSYSTSAGTPLITDAPIAADATVPNDETVSVGVTWNGSWQVTFPPPNSPAISRACVVVAQALNPYLIDPRDNGRNEAIAASIAAENPADGCVFRLTGPVAHPGTFSASDYLHILYRFGALVAVDDVSNYSLLQQLPLADAAETALAQQIDATLPYS